MPSGIERSANTGGSDFVEARGKVESGQDRWELVCRGQLHLIPWDWKQYLELGHGAEDRCNLAEGVLILQARMVTDENHTQFVDEL